MNYSKEPFESWRSISVTERRDKPRIAVLRIGFLDLKVSAGLSRHFCQSREMWTRLQQVWHKNVCMYQALCYIDSSTAVFTHSTMNACFMSLHVSMKTWVACHEGRFYIKKSRKITFLVYQVLGLHFYYTFYLSRLNKLYVTQLLFSFKGKHTPKIKFYHLLILILF